MWILVFQRVFFEAVLDFAYFPLWWYTGGVLHSARWCFSLFLDGNSNLLPFLWLKNLFVPMFGQYDWQGRIISFLMRFVQFIFRSIGLAIWAAFCLVLFFGWLVLPVIITYGFFKSFLR